VKDEQVALARTGTFAWELYATKPNSAWLSPAYSTGADDDPWRDGAFRIDPYWFKDNSADPCDGFYLQFWKLVRQAGIPYRLHWGKFQPKIEIGDPDGWIAFFSAQYPRWKDFLGRRDTHDPSGVFLTHYWRDRFGIGGGG
jgi:D-arabinono-1,4-lactone oxidase